MIPCSQQTVTRIAKKLKRILQDELGEQTKLHQCYKAAAEALDFESYEQMVRALPFDARWNGTWCANHLSDNGYVSRPEYATQAVGLLEETLPWLVASGDPVDVGGSVAERIHGV